ncbi:hypothetical protein AN219_13060, partial [Streptomyces nanshensis]
MPEGDDAGIAPGDEYVPGTERGTVPGPRRGADPDAGGESRESAAARTRGGTREHGRTASRPSRRTSGDGRNAAAYPGALPRTAADQHTRAATDARP